MLVNPKQADTSEFKPIHRLTPQEIKNKKLIYFINLRNLKVKVFEQQ